MQSCITSADEGLLLLPGAPHGIPTYQIFPLNQSPYTCIQTGLQQQKMEQIYSSHAKVHQILNHSLHYKHISWTGRNKQPRPPRKPAEDLKAQIPAEIQGSQRDHPVINLAQTGGVGNCSFSPLYKNSKRCCLFWDGKEQYFMMDTSDKEAYKQLWKDSQETLTDELTVAKCLYCTLHIYHNKPFFFQKNIWVRG